MIFMGKSMVSGSDVPSFVNPLLHDIRHELRGEISMKSLEELAMIVIQCQPDSAWRRKVFYGTSPLACEFAREEAYEITR